MPELKTENASVFIGWGRFLQAFPAIAGTIYALIMNWNSGDLLNSNPGPLIVLAIIVSYMVWGWASALAGAILIVKGNKRKSNAAKLAQPEEPPSVAG